MEFELSEEHYNELKLFIYHTVVKCPESTVRIIFLQVLREKIEQKILSSEYFRTFLAKHYEDERYLIRAHLILLDCVADHALITIPAQQLGESPRLVYPIPEALKRRLPI